jgi:hypothetical protein
MKYFSILIISLLLLSCKTDEDRIPGWYSFSKNMKDFTISGKATYYKNKALKINAKIETSVLPGIAVNTSLVFKGTWAYENGYLKEYFTTVESEPKFIGEAMMKYIKENQANDKGSKVIEVNKEGLKIQTSTGELITYQRLNK